MNTRTPAKPSIPAKRSYRLGARADAKQATRDRILDAVHEAMMTRWYDEVTIAELARAAGVSAPTLINHFGDKHALVAAWGQERMSANVNALRYSVEPGDIKGAARVLVTDYESTGDLVIRALALEHRIPELTSVLDQGRAGHREWVATIFEPRLPSAKRERERAITRLVVATDVYAWQILRRDMKLSRAATQDHMLAIVTAIITTLKETS